MDGASSSGAEDKAGSCAVGRHAASADTADAGGETEERADEAHGRNDAAETVEETGHGSAPAAEVSAEVASLRESVERIRSEVQELRRAGYKDEVIARQQARLAELEAQDKLLAAGRRSAMMLYQLLSDTEESYAKDQEPHSRVSVAQWRFDLDCLRTDLEVLIGALGLTPFRTGEEELCRGSRPIDTATQKAVRTVSTASASEHRTIEKAVRAGFRDTTGRVFRKEEVIVRLYEPPQT